MYCTKCGKNNPEGSEKCVFCGEDLSKSVKYYNESSVSSEMQSKTVAGVLLSFFLGLIGLVIGLLIYPSNTYERKTFIKGWLWTFVIMMIVTVVLVIVLWAEIIKYLALLGYMM